MAETLDKQVETFRNCSLAPRTDPALRTDALTQKGRENSRMVNVYGLTTVTVDGGDDRGPRDRCRLRRGRRRTAGVPHP